MSQKTISLEQEEVDLLCFYLYKSKKDIENKKTYWIIKGEQREVNKCSASIRRIGVLMDKLLE